MDVEPPAWLFHDRDRLLSKEVQTMVCYFDLLENNFFYLTFRKNHNFVPALGLGKLHFNFPQSSSVFII